MREKSRLQIPGILPEIMLLLLAWGLRLYRLGFQSVWWDEGRNINAAMQSLARIPHAPGVDIHPPLYFYLLHFWMPLAGRSEFAIRFLSTWLGMLTLPLLYILGREIFDRKVGLLALLVASLAPFFVGEAQEARMYTLAFLWITATGLAFWKAWNDPKRTRHWVLLGVTSALAVWSHYSALFVLPAFYLLAAADLLRREARKAAAKGLAVSLGTATILFLPQVPIFLRQAIGYENENLVAPRLGQYTFRCWQAFTLGENVDMLWALRWELPLVVLTIAGLAMALWAYRRRGSRPWAFLLTWLLLPMAIYYAVLLRRGAFEPRYISFVAPAYWLLLAVAIIGFFETRKWAGVVALAFFLGAILPSLHSDFSDPRFFRDDTRGLSRFLEQKAGPDDLVVIDAPYPLGFYYPRYSRDPAVAPDGPGNLAPAYYVFADVHTIAETMRNIAGGKHRVFWVHWYKSDADPRRVVPFLLGKYGQLQGMRAFRGYQVSWYTVPPGARYEIADRWQPMGVRFAQGLSIDAVAYGGRADDSPDVDSPRLSADGMAWVAVRWHVDTPMIRDYKASLVMEDSHGHKVAQDDRRLLDDLHVGTSHWRPGDEAIDVYLLRPMPAVMPGRYRILASVYDPDTRKQLPVLDEAGSPHGVFVPIGEVTVEPPVSPEISVKPGFRNGGEAGRGLVLLGRDGLPSEAEPGSTISLRIYWRKTGALVEGGWEYLAMLVRGDERITLASGPVAGDDYPPSAWRVGEVVAPWYDWRIPPDTPQGKYHLRIHWGVSGVRPGFETELGTLTVEGRIHRLEVPAISHPVNRRLDDVAEFLGYETGTPIEGKPLKVTLIWRAVRPSAVSYTVFVHALDASGKVVTQQDSVPGNGRWPTTGWLPREVLVDTYTLRPPEAGWKTVKTLEIGMYDAATGRRVPVAGGGDAIRLPFPAAAK